MVYLGIGMSPVHRQGHGESIFACASTLVRRGEYRAHTGIWRLLGFVSVRTIKGRSIVELMDEKYSEVPMHNNPVSFKVFTWTRWWQMQAEQGTTQGPGLYFCSTGLKQQFGKCRKQYESIPGNALDDKFNTFVTKIADKNLV